MRTITLSTIVAACILCLGACATPYQEMGLAGGVTATQLTADTFQTVATGNGYTNTATIERYALRKAASDVKCSSTEKKAFDGKGLYGEKFATRPLIFWSNISGGTVTVRVWGLKFGSSGPPDLSRPPMVLECTLPCKIDVPVHTQFQILVSPPEGRKLRSGLEVPPSWRDGLFLVQLQPNELKLVFD